MGQHLLIPCFKAFLLGHQQTFGHFHLPANWIQSVRTTGYQSLDIRHKLIQSSKPVTILDTKQNKTYFLGSHAISLNMATKHPTHKTNFNPETLVSSFMWQPPSILHLDRAALVLVTCDYPSLGLQSNGWRLWHTCLKPPADSLGSQPRVQLTTYRSDNGIILGRC